MAWHLLGMLSTSFSAYSVGKERHTSLIRWESCFRVNARLPAGFLFTTLHTFSIEFATGDCEGQSKVVMPFSVFQDVQRWLWCLGSLSSWRIQSLFLAPNILSADLRRPCSQIWSIFWALRFSVKSSKQPKPRCEKHPQTWIFMGCLIVRWRKRSLAVDQARFMGTHAQKDTSSEKKYIGPIAINIFRSPCQAFFHVNLWEQGFLPRRAILHFRLS